MIREGQSAGKISGKNSETTLYILPGMRVFGLLNPSIPAASNFRSTGFLLGGAETFILAPINQFRVSFAGHKGDSLMAVRRCDALLIDRCTDGSTGIDAGRHES